MTWTAREVDPSTCPSYSREQVGSGYMRVVNEPDRPHPGRAPIFHCSDCGRHIGKTRSHVVIDETVICMKCWEDRDYMPGHMASRAAAAQLLGLWPR